MTCTLTHADIAGFTGSEGLHYNPLFGRRFSYTDGVQFLGANGCGWLLDKILATLKFIPTMQGQEFISITLTVNLSLKAAVLTFDDGNDNILHKEDISFTDCTLSEIKFFYTNTILMLASEY